MAKPPKKTLTMTVRIEGVRETLAAFRKLPKDADRELRDRSMSLARTLAGRVKSAAAGDRSPQAATVATTVRARRQRVPVIAAGGNQAIGRRRVPAYRLLFGAEFGSNQYAQFRKPHTSRAGSWLFGVAEREQSTIDREWNQAVDAIVAKWGR